jgi:S1-C subfamily serine protease
VDVTASIAAAFNLPVDSGLGVAAVTSGSPAGVAGLRVNDVIVRIGDVTVNNSGDLLQALTKYRAGDKVTVVFYRGSQQQQVDITLTQRPQ